MAERLQSADEIASRLGTSADYVRELARKGRVPVIRLSDGPKAHMRFDFDAVMLALAGPKIEDRATLGRVASLIEARK